MVEMVERIDNLEADGLPREPAARTPEEIIGYDADGLIS